MELQDRLSFFRELLACDPTIYYWCFDGESQLIASNCPEETVFFPLLRHFCKIMLVRHRLILRQ